MPIFNSVLLSFTAAAQARLARRPVSSADDVRGATGVGRRAALVGARGAARAARRARPPARAAGGVRGLGGGGVERDRPQAEAVRRARARAPAATSPGGRPARGPLRRGLVAARLAGAARGGLDRAGRAGAGGAGGSLSAVPYGPAARTALAAGGE